MTSCLSEFLYDSPRQRFLAREVDPNDLSILDDNPGTPGVDEGAWEFCEYAGDAPQLDYTLTSANHWTGVITERRSYGPGGWEDLSQPPTDPNDPNSPPDPNAPPMVVATRYAHGDLIDSTVLVTDGCGGDPNCVPGSPVATTAYTAFGELVGGAGFQPANMNTRYRYAGGHGYEADVLHGSHSPLNGPNPNLAPITLLHVGARWYDPSIGRFVQRDRLGVIGGLNVYVYVGNCPITVLDPEGLFSWAGAILGSIGGATVGFICGGPPGMAVGAAIGFGVGGHLGDDEDGFGLGADSALMFFECFPFVGSIRHSDDQAVLIALAKDAKRRGGVSRKDAQILLEWAEKLGIRARGPECHTERSFDILHIHIGPVHHIPVY